LCKKIKNKKYGHFLVQKDWKKVWGGVILVQGLPCQNGAICESWKNVLFWGGGGNIIKTINAIIGSNIFFYIYNGSAGILNVQKLSRYFPFFFLSFSDFFFFNLFALKIAPLPLMLVLLIKRKILFGMSYHS
jgi:hypothetical protein